MKRNKVSPLSSAGLMLQGQSALLHELVLQGQSAVLHELLLQGQCSAA